MRTSTATAFAAIMGMSAIHAAPIKSGLPLGASNNNFKLPESSFTEGLTINDAVKEKREASPQRGRRIGNAFEAITGGIGAVADGLLINDVVNGQQKREASPQRGRRIGNAFEAISGGIGAIADGLLINDAVNGQQKREADPQRFALNQPKPTVSRCPDFTCAGGPPAVQEVGIQNRFIFCCGPSITI